MASDENWTDITAPNLPARHAGGCLVYAIGDVHGCYDQLRSLVALIVADMSRRAGDRQPMLIFCGDYIDRGPHSAEVVEAVLWLKANSALEVRVLAGNHEQSLLDFITDPRAAVRWLDYGGWETLRSYGVDVTVASGRRDQPEQLRTALLAAMPASHLNFFETLEEHIELDDCVFVHAGLRAGVPLAEQSRQDLLWIREGFLDRQQDPARLVVHGHSWQDAWPQVAQGRLGIDTGAYETGVLTCIRIDEGRIAYARTSPERAAVGHPGLNQLDAAA